MNRTKAIVIAITMMVITGLFIAIIFEFSFLFDLPAISWKNYPYRLYEFLQIKLLYNVSLLIFSFFVVFYVVLIAGGIYLLLKEKKK